MKDYALELASKHTAFNTKLNVMREYLQVYTLRILQNEGVFRSTAFLGGTALRFLYNLPRYSEDLDFSVIRDAKYSFVDLIKKLKQEFILAGYDISVTYNDRKTVQYAFLKFAGLMYEAGLSPLRNQRFSIKIEIDTNPPEGAALKTNIVNKYLPLSFQSYELESLFAGKLHAIFNRKYTKGRDYFDVGWYLSRWKELCPNLTLLKNALLQTKWGKEIPSERTWRKFLYDVVKNADWKKVKKDVENLLENPSDLNVFSKENILALIKR